jgi:molecular chaperone HscA
VKPSYGLSDADIARMLEESHLNAAADMTARALAEARVDAARILDATEGALAVDAELLDADERAALDDAVARLRRLVDENEADRRALVDATEALNRASEAFAGRRMDRSVAQALTGRSIDSLR